MSSIPCRVSAELRQYEHEQSQMLDLAPFMEQAREEVIEILMEGKQFDGWTFHDILDCEIDSNVRSTVADIAAHMNSIVGYAKDDHTHVEARQALRQWMQAMVERFVDSKPDLIEARAAYLAERDSERD